MEGSIAIRNRKWRTPGDPAKFRLSYPKLPVRTTEDWDNWVKAMKMDLRFTGTERDTLTTLALHYNLTTGDCFPSHGRVAVESGLPADDNGERTVRRTIKKAKELGWIKVTHRWGGDRKKNQTNLYDLRLPQSIWDVLNNVGPKLAVVETNDGRWNVAQVTDGVAICGPFKDRANAERWIAEHGPTGEIRPPTGHIVSEIGGRPDIYAPQNREVRITGNI